MVDSLSRNPQNSIGAWLPCLAALLLGAVCARAQFGAQPVGVASAPQQIQVAAKAPGIVGRVEVLTLGAPGGDFAAGAGPSTCAAAALTLESVCELTVVFTPAMPGLRLGAVVLVGAQNGADTVLGVTYLSGTGTEEAGDSAPKGAMRIGGQPEDPDGAGNLYIADRGHNSIRMVCGPSAIATIHGARCAAAGDRSTVAGNGGSAYTGDAGPAANAALNHPASVAVDGAGNLYIADTGNNVVRTIDAVTGLISTFAGNAQGTICNSATNSAGDGCPATEATLKQPQSVTVDAGGNLYIADAGNNATLNKATRFVSQTTGIISTLVAAPTTSAIVSSLDPAGFGQSVTFTATVSAPAGAGNLTGSVSIADTYNGAAATLVSGLALDPSGEAAFSISTLGVGQHSITASYSNAGDPAHSAGTSPALVETVLEGTAVRLTSSANPAAAGQSVTFTAQVGSSGGGVAPTGTVTFYDGAATLCAAALNTSGSAICATSSLANGAHQIAVVYGGNSSAAVEGSTSPVVNQVVQAPSSMAVASSLNPSTYGVAVTFTATIASTAASPARGTVSFLDNGVSIGTAALAGNPATAAFTSSTLAAGAHLIAAAYAGDSSNQSSSSSASPLNHTVAQAQTVTTISVSPISGVAGAAETLTAAVEPAQGAAPLAGTVSFTSGTILLGSAQVNASGLAAISPTLAAGTYEIVATYQGSANAMGSASNVLACSGASPKFCSGSGPLLYTVTLAATETALAVSPAAALAASPVTFTATVAGSGPAPTGSVNFLANGAVVGTAPLNGLSATFTDSSLPAGSYALTAEYLGDANDAVSSSTSIGEAVSLIPTATAVTGAATTGADPQVTLTATVAGNGSRPAPSGVVTFTSSGAPLGTASLDANGVAKLTPTLIVGADYSIGAAYSGDAYHGSSTSPTIGVAGVASGFTVSVVPASVALSSSQSATVTVTLTSIASFADTVSLSCASLPAMVRCQFAAASLSLAAGGTATTQLTIAAGNTPAAQSAAINRSAGNGSFRLAGVLPPFALAFGWFLRRRRWPRATALSAAIPILAAAALAATGCTAVLQAAASPGNYIVQVTGSGTASNVVRSQDLNLEIAK